MVNYKRRRKWSLIGEKQSATSHCFSFCIEPVCTIDLWIPWVPSLEPLTLKLVQEDWTTKAGKWADEQPSSLIIRNWVDRFINIWLPFMITISNLIWNWTVCCVQSKRGFRLSCLLSWFKLVMYVWIILLERSVFKFLFWWVWQKELRNGNVAR